MKRAKTGCVLGAEGTRVAVKSCPDRNRDPGRADGVEVMRKREWSASADATRAALSIRTFWW